VAKNGVNMTAFNKSIRDLEKTLTDKLVKVEDEFKNTMQTMKDEAVAAAPKDTGELKSSIKWLETSKLTYELRADVPYAAFVEFGTGRQSIVKNYSRFWQDVAVDFWTRKPNEGLPPQPFFYPTVNKNIAKLKTKIKSILSKNA
jgi:HK97 gp10 family phage protein